MLEFKYKFIQFGLQYIIAGAIEDTLSRNAKHASVISPLHCCSKSNTTKSTFDGQCDLKNSADFINFDVEVIVKGRDKDYFQTLYIRKDAIKIFNEIENYKDIKMIYKVNDNYYMNIEKKKRKQRKTRLCS